VFQYHERVAVLFQDGHELENGEGPPYFQSGKPVVHAAEDTRIVPADIQNLESLQALVAVQSLDQHLPWGNEDIEGSGDKRYGRM